MEILVSKYSDIYNSNSDPRASKMLSDLINFVNEEVYNFNMMNLGVMTWNSIDYLVTDEDL